MRIKEDSMFMLILGFLIMFSSCEQKQFDNVALCKEFYELNKGKDFEGLFDIAMGGRRGESIFDESSRQYFFVFYQIDIYDTKSEKFNVLPIFKRGASSIEQDSAFIQVSSEAINILSRKHGDTLSRRELLLPYVEYINMLYEKYDNIKTPQLHSSRNVVVEGIPSSGKFIRFTLNDNCKVYYLADRSSLTKYWQKHFDKINKLDENWYYEIAITK